mmetsp:Transcript_33810/g.49497  ORF Transcript_33810/g.49497 Transcript_33810/m.49497 type:complete len:110 (-) Transcript_33810:76-405(-)
MKLQPQDPLFLLLAQPLFLLGLDIALSWLLGMNIVTVAGSQHQIDQQLDASDALDSIVQHNSNRVTDAHTLQMVKEGAGFVRFEIERQLAPSLKAAGLGSIISDSKKRV